MSSNKCTYCDNRFVHEDISDFACPNCKNVVEKLDKETIDWLMMVIDAKIEKAVDDHASRYDHELSSYHYY